MLCEENLSCRQIFATAKHKRHQCRKRRVLKLSFKTSERIENHPMQTLPKI